MTGKRYTPLIAALTLLASLWVVAPGRAAEPLEDSVRTVPDSSKHAAKGQTFARLLSEADSTVKAQGGSKADDAQLFLSWNAPWGTKRVQHARMPACADSMAEDTLFLSFLAGRSGRHFTGFTGQLLFHATGTDTLGRWWHMQSKGGENPGSMRVEWAANPGFGWKQPFAVTGQGFALLENRPSEMLLRVVFAVPYDDAGPVAPDSIYTLARVILKHHPARQLAGCEQPVCVEWSSATLAFDLKDEPEVHRGERFVAFAGPYAICEPFKSRPVQPWKPKPAKTTAGSK